MGALAWLRILLFYFQLPDLIRRSIISLCQVRLRKFLDIFVKFIYHFTLYSVVVLFDITWSCIKLASRISSMPV